MKKKILIPLLFASLFSLSACTGNNNKPDTPVDPSGEVDVLVESITLNETAVTLRIGETFQINATVLPDNATKKGVTYTSSVDGIIGISDSGLVTALREGTTVVIVSATDTSNKSAYLSVTVSNGGSQISLSRIEISGYTTTYEVGDTFRFDGTVKAYYSDGTNKTVQPTSVSSPDMSTTGTKEVTVSYTENGVTKSKSYTITVNEKHVDPPVPEGRFGELVTAIKTGHNYTMHVESYLEGYHTEEDTYIDEFVNINDKAFYANYYSGKRGYIYQKNQGFVLFTQMANGDIVPEYFYSTNPNVGISSLVDYVGENIFLAEYTKGVDGNYHCENDDVITVVSNLSGYLESSWFVAGEEVMIEVGQNSLTVNFEFSTWYIDEGVGKMTPGYCTIVIDSIGTSTNPYVEAYIENPSTKYETPTAWTAGQNFIFQQYFGELTMPFLPNASYSMDLDIDKDYEGWHVYLTDYGCGNQIDAYAALIAEYGFSKVEGEGYKYQLVFNDDEVQKTKTYIVEMAYLAPNEDYYGRKVSLFYPNGAFQAKFTYKSVAYAVDTVDKFNAYIERLDLGKYVPLLPFGDEVTKITKFEDVTEKNNQELGDYYLFYTTPYMNVYMDYESAVRNVEAYGELLTEWGYDNKITSSGGIALPNTYENTTWNDDASYYSHVKLTNMDFFTESNYPGYIQIQYKIFIPDHPKGDTPDALLTSIEISDYSTDYTVGDTFSFDGVVTAHYDDGSSKVVTPTSVTEPDMSQPGSKTIYVNYTERGRNEQVTYTITISDPEVTPHPFGEFGGDYVLTVPKGSGTYYNEYRLRFYDNGTGTYTRTETFNPEYTSEPVVIQGIARFTYTCNETTGKISITLTGWEKGDNSSFTVKYRLFVDSTIGNGNNTGAWTSETDSIEISLVDASGNLYSHTFNKVVA